MLRSLPLTILAGLLILPGSSTSAQRNATPEPEAVTLRNVGLAQLENEESGDAEATFRELSAISRDPLGFANLAIAQHRQQKQEDALANIDRALQAAPGRADLLGIKAEILAWSGSSEEALQVYRQAFASAPTDPETVYALYRHATTLRGDDAEQAAAIALDQLTRLRPDNVVLLLRQGVQTIEAGDRAQATALYLRIRELLWQTPEILERELQKILTALEANDLAAARGPSRRLENGVRGTPLFRNSLEELYTEIQGIPVTRFADERLDRWGEPVSVRLEPDVLDDTGSSTPGLLAADLDGDDKPDVARLIGNGDDTKLRIERTSSLGRTELAAPGARGLTLADLDNDGFLDLFAFGPNSDTRAWRGGAGGRFQSADFGLGRDARALVIVDFDAEGDLDVIALEQDGLRLYRNNLTEGAETVTPLERVEAELFPEIPTSSVAVVIADFDGDCDHDLLLVSPESVLWLDNVRGGQFRDRSTNAGLGGIRGVASAGAVAVADLDNDGHPEIVLAGAQLRILENHAGVFRAATTRFADLPQSLTTVRALDIDNDGRLDLVAGGAGGIAALQQLDNGWRRVEIADASGADGASEADNAPGASIDIAAEDLDLDGDLDLVVATTQGLLELRNEGGNRNHWLRVRLRGLDKGNSKNNLFGFGATLEIRAGDAYQKRQVSAPVTHFGLGTQRRADLLRVTWANCVPQNRLRPDADQLVVEEQVLKGSCPFVYSWNGDGIVFETDLLWGAPLGMPVAAGIYAPADPHEIVRLDHVTTRDGLIDLRITEELWEAAFFDLARLWVVDHPSETEAASSLRVFSSAPAEHRNTEVRLSGDVRAVAAARDGKGRDVTERVASRDEIYADGYDIGDYQGVAPRPWALSFDLGTAPEQPIRLLLDGWIFPSDASINVAVAQRNDLQHPISRLEVRTTDGWQVLLDPLGFPAGKTKTTIVDTPPLPVGASELRIVSSRWLHWDRIAWSMAPRDDEARMVAQLTPHSAELRYRGFSQLVRQAPNGPHLFDYGAVRIDSPWQPMRGRFTRYGDVADLLTTLDDRLVVLAPGDEIALLYQVADLPPPAPGLQRSYFLESFGWDKDADLNTYESDLAGPYPYRDMPGYPYSETYPPTDELRRYLQRWQTREITQ